MLVRRIAWAMIALGLLTVWGATNAAPHASSAIVRKLNGPLPASGDVGFDLTITPDGRSAVFVADQELDQRFELYQAALPAGPPARKLSAPAHGSVISFALAPDSLRAVYQTAADPLTGSNNLYGVALAGGPVAHLGPPASAGAVLTLEQIAITPDSTRVLYRTLSHTTGEMHLYSVPITGGTPTRLDADFAAAFQVDTFAISPDSQLVAFTWGDVMADEYHLVTVPVAGGAPVDVYANADFDRAPRDLSVTTDAQVLFTSGLGLYEAPVAGGAVLTRSLDVYAHRLLAAEDLIVLWRDADHNNQHELIAINRGSGAVAQLSPAGQHASQFSHVFSADHQALIFTTRGVSTTFLYSAALSGGPPALLAENPNGIIVADLTPDGQTVIYQSYQSGYGPPWSVPRAGGPATPLLAGAPPQTQVLSHAMPTADSQAVLVVLDRTAGVELDRLPLAGGPPERISPPLVAGGQIFLLGRYPGGAIYIADQELDNRFEAYNVIFTGQRLYLPMVRR